MRTRNVIVILSVLALTIQTIAWAVDRPNELSAEEAEAGFVSLFNGKDLEGWSPVEGPWTVRDNAIQFRDLDSWAGSEQGLMCESHVIPGNFDLRFEWKEYAPVSEDAAGFLYVGTNMGTTQEGGNWTGPLFCGYLAGGRSVILLTNEVTIPLEKARFISSANPSLDARLPAGQWNESRMICKGPEFQHWLNGKQIVSRNLRKGKGASLLASTKSGEPLLKEWLEIKKQGFRIRFDVLGKAVAYRSIRVCRLDDAEDSE